MYFMYRQVLYFYHIDTLSEMKVFFKQSLENYSQTLFCKYSGGIFIKTDSKGHIMDLRLQGHSGVKAPPAYCWDQLYTEKPVRNGSSLAWLSFKLS